MTMNRPPAEPGHTSLLDEFGRTRETFMGLFHAHVALLKAEINQILDQVKSMAAMGGVAFALALVLFNMLYIGGLLFLGEWLFGSIGWGFAHGVLLAIGLIVAMVLGIMGAGGRSTLISFLIALVIVFVVGFLCGSNAGYNLAASASGSLAQPLGTPGVVALLAGIVFGALLFTLLLARVAGRNGAIGGFFLGALLGALLGWLIAGAPWTWQPAFGFAITIGLLAWPILNFIIAWPGINLEERFGNLYPRQSIEAATETKEWLEEQWQTRLPLPKRGNK